LFPAMTMQEFVFVDRMSLGHFSYSNWLLLSGFYYEKDVDLRPIWRVFFVFVDLVVLVVTAFILAHKSEDFAVRRKAACWFGVGIAAALMMTDVSRPVWAFVPTLQKVQFPFRFGVVVSIAVTALLVLVLPQLKDASAPNASRVLVLFCAFLWLPYAAWGFSHYANPVRPDDVELKNNVIRDRRDQPEYRPRWSQTMAAIDWNASTNEDEWSDKLDKDYGSLLDRTGARDPSTPRALTTSGSGHAEVVRWGPREITVRTHADAPVSVRILQFYLPGWQARVADSGEKLEVSPTEPDGLISVKVPAGDHEIAVELGANNAESVGKIVSAGSATLIFLYWIVLAAAKTRTRMAT
jgi:hypothetical protein